MSDATSASSSGGIGLGGLLTVAFVVLKLCGVINWSWVWVLAPTWIPVAIALLFLLGLAVVSLIALAVSIVVGWFIVKK